MKVIIVAPYLASKGGAGRFTWELSEYLASKDDSVTLISLYTDRNIYESKENLMILDLTNKNMLTQSMSFWLNLGKIREKLRKLIIDKKPDIVLFMNFPATLWAQKFDNIPVLCYPQDINLLYTNTYIRNLSWDKYLLWIILRFFVRIYDKKKWKSFDEIICNSKFSAEHISKIYKIKTKVIHLGTRIHIFTPSNVTKKVAILSIAAQKAQRTDFLIRAAAELYQRRKDFEIWIVGSSNSHDLELKKLVSKYNLNDVVKFFGKVSDSELVKLYSESLVVVHLVRAPPFGMIVTEAMACGTPVIACKPGGTEETIIHEETGFLIDDNDSESLTRYIERFLDEPNLSNVMGKKGRIRVEKFFDMNEKNKEMRMLMQEWVNKKSKSLY